MPRLWVQSGAFAGDAGGAAGMGPRLCRCPKHLAGGALAGIRESRPGEGYPGQLPGLPGPFLTA